MEIIEDDLSRLRKLQKSEKDKRRYIKITVLLMLNLGDSVDRISTTLGIHINTIGNYIETYQK